MPNGSMQGVATSSSPYQYKQPSPNKSVNAILNAASTSAALRGATLAFGRPSVISKQQANTYSGKNGALAAASKAGSAADSGRQTRSMEQQARNTYIEYNGTSHLTNTPLFAAQQSVFREKIRDLSSKPSSASLQLPLEKSTNRTRSPSNIAATLAASRVTPQNSGNSVASRLRAPVAFNPEFQYSDEQLPPVGTVRETKKQLIALSDIGSLRHISRETRPPSPQSSGGSTDSTPIPPTNALIGIFEANHEISNLIPTSRQEELPSVTQAQFFKPPTQIPLGRSTVYQAVDKESTNSEVSRLGRHVLPLPLSNGPKPSIDYIQRPDSPKTSDSESAVYVIKTKDAALNSLTTTIPGYTGNISKAQAVRSLKNTPPKLPPTRRRRNSEANPVVVQKPSTNDSDNSSAESFVSATDVKDIGGSLEKPNTQLIKESFVSRPNLRSTSSLNLAAQVSPTWQGETRGYKMPSRISSQLTGESLADAIVASSLATSRAPSPTKPSRPPPPPRHPKSLSLFHHRHHSHEESRSASPAKGIGLRQTMRKIKSEDDDDDASMQKRGRKKILRTHPNKHHEGDRNRWRDEITERERKRYEGVWAANKGLHPIIFPGQPPSSALSPANLVSNLVTRDIWSRSRLSDSVLEEVWDLVNQTLPGSLTREEFVVGLWLIDQRLKGRKLPIRVSDSVWGSVRGPGGVRMPKQRKR
ncbi:MAG: Increased rDNA silencing protein [Trizodia sp. TS-e1964]|nr:MAG: Increased rDNA silencing protein [Trizodia sp. TS-e1964]